VHFQRVWFAGGGAVAREGAPSFTIAGDASRGGRRRGKSERREGKGSRRRSGSRASGATARKRARGAAEAPSDAQGLFEALRAWRLAEARKAGIPAFRVMNDRTLLGVASEAPRDEGALLRVAGVGPGVVRRYGQALLDICARFA
jgi:superfamily II DNA helicase RecQ